MADDRPSRTGLPVLVMTGGPLDGTAYPVNLSGAVVIGSSMDCDVQILLGNVEPFHARVAAGAEGLRIADAGSATGTFVNGERIGAEVALHDGDRVCLGPPGAKGSAKLLVLLKGAPGVTAASIEAPAAAEDLAAALGEVAVAELEPEVDVVDLSEEPAVTTPFGDYAAPSLEAPPAPGAEASYSAPAPPAPPPPPATAPPPAREERLTAPPPVEAPPPPPPRHAAKADYQTDLPSIPVQPASPLSRSADHSAEPSDALDEPFPPLKPSRKTAGSGRSTARRRRLMPQLGLAPAAAGLAGLAVLGGLAWFFLLREAPKTPAAPPAVAAAATGNAPAPTGRPGASAGGLQPDVAMPGQTVLIRAEGLAVPDATVTIGGLPAASVEATAEGLRAVVPALGLPEGSRTTVAVQAPGKPVTTLELLVGRLPLVLEADPASAAIGDTLVLAGRGFSAEPAANAVTVGGQRALVLAATAEQLRIVAPAPGAGDMPEVPIVVSAGGRTSSVFSGFRLIRTGGGSFIPRFFAAPVTESPADGLAFVSTELGPLVVLGGPAGAGSTADRAVALAADLNALVAQAASRQLGFEARDNPQPAVAVVGDARPLLVATAEDVAAYARPWDGRGSARRVAAPALARHWAAVLQDYLGLFMYRQRPLKVLAMSSRGQVLADLYGEAARRSPGGTGVPSGLLLPLTPAMARDLRSMALVVSAEPGRAAVALEGRWSGTISDPDLGERPFTVELRSERGRLAGTLTTSRGGIALNSPLRDIGLDRGTARFTTDLQGTSYRFRGALEGNVVSGTIERPGRAPARFTMQYAE